MSACWFFFQEQLTRAFQKKSVFIVFCVNLAFTGVNMAINFLQYRGLYQTQMFQAMKISTMSSWSLLSFIFMQIYPFLLVTPFAGDYIHNQKSGVNTYLRYRVSRRCFLYVSLAVVFVTTFLIFSLPLLAEGMIYSITIPSAIASGDPSNLSYFDSFRTYDGSILFSNLYLENADIYYFCMILLFGMVTGILACLNYAITLLPIFKITIFTYLPIYAILLLLSALGEILSPEMQHHFAVILPFFSSIEKAWLPCYGVCLLVFIAITILITEIKIRRSKIL